MEPMGKPIRTVLESFVQGQLRELPAQFLGLGFGCGAASEVGCGGLGLFFGTGFRVFFPPA